MSTPAVAALRNLAARSIAVAERCKRQPDRARYHRASAAAFLEYAKQFEAALLPVVAVCREETGA
jgi:hypothetical protein